MEKKYRTYNFYESGGSHSNDYSPRISVSPTVIGNSKFDKIVNVIILNLQNGDTINKTFCSKGFPLVGSMQKTGELIISN